MKFSYNWLKELSGTTKNVDEIAELFMTHSFEVEGIEDLSKGLDKVVIGEVLTKEKHPDADKLNVAMVNVGDEELQIVCGAPNLEAGQKVPVALVGAVLPDGDNGFEIKKSKIRGVESNGMICAQDELGIGTDHEGIVVLSEDAPVGEHFAKYAELEDTIIDIDILPNRGHDALSYQGIANEIKAFEGNIESQTHPNPLPEGEGEFHIQIDTQKCSRYIGIKIKGIEIKESPKWMQARLKASGIGSINNIVDITNYVMLETGQPLHAFSADKAGQIGVRQAKEEEKLTILDEQELELDSKDIVITDGEKSIALAGVMGGLDSAINDSTKDIILESASFDSSSIRFTQRKYNLQTDAAYRFERDIDPNLAEIAAARAAELIMEFADGTVESVSDIYPKPVTSWSIELSPQKVQKLLGVEIAVEEMKNILERLDMDVDVTENAIIVTVPTIRIDLKAQEDLIEEIGRMYGYDKIKPKALEELVQTPNKNEQRFFERTLKDIFVHGGFDEVRSYSFYSRDDAGAIGLQDENHIALMNPMSPEQAIMRRTLMPNLLHFAKKNFSYFNKVNIFEIGRIYDPVQDVLPDEKLVLGGVVASKESDGSQFFELKGIIETLFSRVNIGEFYFDSEFDENA
ncbi:MAG: phenylalanine--tRNA ligase subunit beta, partial [Patescibacteria group bacterium]